MSVFPRRWPPTMADEIQLYTLNTPNGQKVSIALEEMELSYEAHLVNILADEQFDADFLKLSPNGKIPTLIDPRGPEGETVVLMESVAILIYLADKTGRFLPQNYLARMEHLQWLFFQAAHIGPMFGQFGHFYRYAGDQCEHPYPVTRYSNEARRLLGVLEERLKGRDFLMGEDYSLVDMATCPWVECLEEFYQAAAHLGLDDFPQVQAWRQRVTSRPAYARGRMVGSLP